MELFILDNGKKADKTVKEVKYGQMDHTMLDILEKENFKEKGGLFTVMEITMKVSI